MLGVLALVVVLSVMSGFVREQKKRLLSTELHILMTPTAETRAQGLNDTGLLERETALSARLTELRERGQITAIWPVLQTEVILRSGRRVTGVQVKGMTAGKWERARKTIVEMVDSRFREEALAGVFVGQELATEMGLVPGDKVSLVSPTETEGPLSSVPRMRKVQVEGIYRSGLMDQELHTVLAHESAVRSFLRDAHSVSSWEITLANPDESEKVVGSLRGLSRSFSIQDWMDLNAQLFASLRLERFAMAVSLLFIVIVAAFNIVTTLTLMVIEKRREISVLKTMGATHFHIAKIFAAEGLLIGLMGTVAGIVSGLALCVALSRYSVIQLPEIYYDRTLPVEFLPSTYVGIAIATLVVVLAACSFPSRKAARLNPLDGIRQG